MSRTLRNGVTLISGSTVVVVPNWTSYTEKWLPLPGRRIPSYQSSVSLCGYQWEFTVFPYGIFGDSDYIGFQLRNPSNHRIEAEYSVHMAHCSWTDPEGTVIFHPAASGDNVWGCEEFIHSDELDALRTDEEKMHNRVKFTITMTAKELESKLIEDENQLQELIDSAAEEADLIQFANVDLTEVARKFGKSTGMEKRIVMQDTLVRSRLASSESTGTKPKYSGKVKSKGSMNV